MHGGSFIEASNQRVTDRQNRSFRAFVDSDWNCRRAVKSVIKFATFRIIDPILVDPFVIVMIREKKERKKDSSQINNNNNGIGTKKMDRKSSRGTIITIWFLLFVINPAFPSLFRRIFSSSTFRPFFNETLQFNVTRHALDPLLDPPAPPPISSTRWGALLSGSKIDFHFVAGFDRD